MKMMIIGCGIITTFFSILYVVKFPREYWEFLTFRSDGGIIDHLVSIATIAFLITSALAVVFLIGL